MLTKDSVSVLRQQFLNFNGEEMQVGGNIRNAYMNDESGREQLRKVLSDEYYNAVMAVWQWMIQIESWKWKIENCGRRCATAVYSRRQSDKEIT